MCVVSELPEMKIPAKQKISSFRSNPLFRYRDGKILHILVMKTLRLRETLSPFFLNKFPVVSVLWKRKRNINYQVYVTFSESQKRLISPYVTAFHSL